MTLKEKIAIVTGASSGIGEATAKALAAQGAKVVLVARRADRIEKLKYEIEENGGKALAFVGDVTDKNRMDEIVSIVIAEFGKIDILVNNAGIMPLSFVKNLHLQEWNNMVDVNIKGVMNCTAAVLPNMMDNKNGHIVNVSSVAGRKIFPGAAVYCATKFAVNAFSEGLRMELSKYQNIRVTVVEPGAVSTELQSTITDEELMNSMMSRYKDMKFLKPEDIAAGVVYAVSQPNSVNVSELMIMPSDQD
eukprot:TRINITY_DN21210_c0_g1_i1.p1 TRINITY_DN21210_c0_g1~~TRINITY_DN21210_c0_g1_i1.p1  ORF type:complete len:248 (-),score=-8.10 TRINITY_DN21210_c0_g1_i1:168-911(-)